MALILPERAIKGQRELLSNISKIPVLGKAAELLLGSTPKEQITSSLLGLVSPIGMARVPGVPFVKFKKPFQDILGKIQKVGGGFRKESDVIKSFSENATLGLQNAIDKLSSTNPKKVIDRMVNIDSNIGTKFLKEAGVTGVEKTAARLKALQVSSPKQFQRFDETLKGELTKFINKTLEKVIE